MDQGECISKYSVQREVFWPEIVCEYETVSLSISGIHIWYSSNSIRTVGDEKVTFSPSPSQNHILKDIFWQTKSKET